MPTRTIGPFQLEKQIGAGGMGNVYLATFTKTGRKVALKILAPDSVTDRKIAKRFEREIGILKKLRHPNIVQYLAAGTHRSQRFFAMELMPRGSLEKLLNEKGRLSWEQTIEYGIDICKALEHAHTSGVIHRDLKPANLFVTKEGRLKLGDFGIARTNDATQLTAKGRTVGTYAYMAPEQISGSVPISAKTDLYALGCVLYQMLTGRPPFQAETPGEMLYKHLQDEPERIASTAIDCPIWLEEVVMQLLKKAPEERPYDAPFVEMKLKEVGKKVAEQSSMATHVASGKPTSLSVEADRGDLKKLLGKKKRKRKKRKHVPVFEKAWFLVCCLVALAGLLTWLLWPPSEEELFREAERLMAEAEQLRQENDEDYIYLWQDARDDYLQPMLERFPNGQHADQAREFLDRIAMHQAIRQARLNARLGKEPASEGERLFRAARKYEQFGDRVTALEQYRSMVELLKGREKERSFVNAARHQIAEIRAAGVTEEDRIKIVEDALARADELMQKGRVLQAREIWRSIVTLYAGNAELEPQVEAARAHLQNREEEAAGED